MQEEFTDPFLQQRYGLAGRRRGAWLAPALLLALVGGAWLLWSANHYAQPEIRSTLISFKASSAQEMVIRYSVAVKDPHKSHSCQLVARDYATNVVGEVTDQIPTGTSSETRTVKIPTRLLAVNAAVLNCTVLQ